jgi:peptidoglycan hydrolase-like protein with peptidoglycan-binding domain
MPCMRVAAVTRSALTAFAVLAFTLTPATRAPANTPDPAAGWHGRAILNPHHHAPTRTSAPPAGWTAGPVGPGTGLRRAHGSERVREVQRRLRRLGYRPGPVDGIYGPRTRAATRWFQLKHGLPRTGTATLATVVHLRQRTRPQPRTRTTRHTPTTTTTTTATLGAPVPFRDDGGFTWWPWLVAALAVAVATGALVARRRPAPATHARPAPRVLGYVRVPHGDDAALEAQLAAVEAECRARGLALERIVTDELDDRRGRHRPGLTYALDRLGRDGLDCLAVTRIEQIADRQVDLHDTLQRISEHGAVLVVLSRGPHHTPARPRTARQPRPEPAHA